MPRLAPAVRLAAARELAEVFAKRPTMLLNVPSVSRSGLSRKISVTAAYIHGDAVAVANLSSLIATVLELPGTVRDGVTVRGTGMDMGFWTLNTAVRATAMLLADAGQPVAFDPNDQRLIRYQLV